MVGRLVTHEATSIRAEIIADDALNVLAPSLEVFHGCHILDISPGPGLWSSKVHELLKPQTHLLLEPDKDAYMPFLRPLLEAPHSKYKYLATSLFSFNKPASIYHLDKIWDMINTPRGDSERGNPTTRVLILANLSTIKTAPAADLPASRSPSEAFLYNYALGLVHRCGLHEAGSARLLAWVLDADRGNILPRSLSGRFFATGRTLEELCEVGEVVGSGELPKPRRPAKYDLQSVVDTARRMRENGIAISAGRQTALLQRADRCVLDSSDPALKAGRALPHEPDLTGQLEELRSMERDWSETVSRLPQRRGKRTKGWPSYKPIHERRRMLDDYIDKESQSPVTGAFFEHLAMTETKLNQMERDYAGSEADTASKAALKLEMDKLAGFLGAEYDALTTKERRLVSFLADNHGAFHSDPPRLAWDRRQREPLSTDHSEFWPDTHRLSLLDIQPRPRPSSLGAALIQEPFVRVLLSEGLLPVAQALERIAFGAAEAILPRCAAVRDPLRGGRLHLRFLRCRMLTSEMVEEMLREWQVWPFKRSNDELSHMKSKGESGGESFAPD